MTEPVAMADTAGHDAPDSLAPDSLAPDSLAPDSLAPGITIADRTAALGADLRAIAVPYIVARVLVGLGYVLAKAVAARWDAITPQPLTQGLVAWDGAFYRDVGVVGYEHLPLEALRFFPLYSVVSRAVSLAFGGNQGFALVLVANVSALVLAVLVRRFVRAEFDEVTADRAVWAVLLFPGAFVLVWAYAEALFLVLCVGAIHAARRQRWLVAGSLAFAAGLTRPIGVVLVVPLAIEGWTSWNTPGRPWSERVSQLAGVAAPAAGGMAFVLWVERAWGRLFLPYTVQSGFRGETTNPIARLLKGAGDLFGPERFGAALHIPFAVMLVVLVVVAWRRLPRSLAAFATIILVVSLSAANLNSLERYGLNAFPLAMALAVWAASARRERIALAVCGSGVMALSALAWLGLYVP